MIIGYEPLNESTLLVWFRTAQEAVAWSSSFLESSRFHSLQCVTAYRSVAVSADLDEISLPELLLEIERSPFAWRATTHRSSLHVIPVHYDGMDLPSVAEFLDCSISDVVIAHTRRDYAVQAIGFRPGFPYLGTLDSRIAGLPRLDSPRTRVPAGSVAIVGDQTAIYPEPSPGGWHLIGHTHVPLFDEKTERFLLQVGDLVRFQSVSA